MKKLIKPLVVTIVLGFAGLSILSAEEKNWTNFLGFGITAPAHGDMNIKAKEFDVFGTYSNMMLSKDITFYDQIGISFDYMGIHRNGFAVRAAFGTGHTGFNNKWNWDRSLFFDMNFGAGYAPLRTEHFTLAAFGMLGFTGCRLKTDWNNGIAIYETTAYSIKEKEKVYYHAATIGANVTGVYTFEKRFSLYGSLGVDYVCPGKIKMSRETKYDFSYTNEKRNIGGTYRIIPTFGVCWKF